MFSTFDSKTYQEVADWFINGKVTKSLSIRPILYPLLLLIFGKTFGVFGIWFLNLIFWFLGINFIFMSLRKLTKNIILSSFGVIIVIGNISLIALTFHAITELMIFCFLSAFIYFIVKNIERWKEIYFIHGFLFILILLSITKPVFIIPFLICLLALPFYWRQYFKNKVNILKLILILIPLIIQLSIMKLNFGLFTVSKISHITLNAYFIAQGIQEIEGLELYDARIKAMNFSSSQRRKYLIKHYRVFKNNYIKNLENNIYAEATYLKFPEQLNNKYLADKMYKTNEAYLYWHKRFLWLMLLAFAICIIRKNYWKALILILLSLFCAYYLLTSAISFWQGDRLVLPAIALWSVLYVFIVYIIFEGLLISIKRLFLTIRKNKEIIS